MALAPRAVVVHRRTELDDLLDQHGTRGQAEFFLRTRGRTLDEVQQHHDLQSDALRAVSAAIPVDWRRGGVEREDLPRFVFEPGDVLLVVGQDGLVANSARYLSGQPVIGVDPEPGRNPGVLVHHTAAEVARLLPDVIAGSVEIERRTMARAELDDGQALDTLNEVYVGHPTHQSARYRIAVEGRGGWERQSSSGLIASTGSGATGWAASISHDRGGPVRLPKPGEPSLAWFVREAWPSPSTGTTLTAGVLAAGNVVELIVESNELVVFGDGQESDRLTATWGQGVVLRVSNRTLSLVARSARQA
jgi:NAD kinase